MAKTGRVERDLNTELSREREYWSQQNENMGSPAIAEDTDAELELDRQMWGNKVS